MAMRLTLAYRSEERYISSEFFNVYRKFSASSVVYLETINRLTLLFLENIHIYNNV